MRGAPAARAAKPARPAKGVASEKQAAAAEERRRAAAGRFGLAVVREREGKVEEAERLLRHAVEALRGLDDHSAAVTRFEVRSRLAALLRQQERPGEAEAEARAALEASEGQLDPTHAGVVATTRLIAELVEAQSERLDATRTDEAAAPRASTAACSATPNAAPPAAQPASHAPHRAPGANPAAPPPAPPEKQKSSSSVMARLRRGSSSLGSSRAHT